jgi:hypothetical protein
MKLKWLPGVLLVCALGVHGLAGACEDHPTSKPAKSKQVKTLKSSGSAETRAERAARLQRECKGLPNAGACYGFAS